jgi:hypothetical protein
MLQTIAKSLSRLCLWLTARPRRCVTAYAAVALGFALSRWSTEPYDDAHFFKRIALNALEHGVLAWNLEEGPVHGASSQSFQGVAVALVALARDHYTVATRAFSIACLVSAFTILVRLTARFDRGASAVFGFGSAVLLYPTISGMETALAVLAGTLLLWAATSERVGWGVRPLALLFVYLTRPDAALLGAIVLSERWWRLGRRGFVEALVSAAALAAALACFKLYYGTALPLPFYAKQAAFSPYDAFFLRLSAESGAQRFAVFALSAVPLLLRAASRRDRTNLSLLAAAALFVACHRWLTVDVMGMQGRFYAPCLPLLILASARAGVKRPARAHRVLAASFVLALFVVLRATDGLPSNAASRLEAFPNFLQLASGLGGAALLLATGRRRWHHVFAASFLFLIGAGSLEGWSASEKMARSDDDFLALQTSRYTIYRGLDTLRSCFGERVHVYHSEVGLPGLRFRAGKVTDLAGLLSHEWLFREKSADELAGATDPRRSSSLTETTPG